MTFLLKVCILNKMNTFLTKNVIPGNILIKKAKGIRLWDQNDKEYLDFSSQTLNLNLGNAPDIAKKAFLKQFDQFTFLSSRFESAVFMRLSKKIIDLAPKELTKINLKLTNGSDANESALKRARAYHKKPYVISFYLSHLGESSETLSASGKHFNANTHGGSDFFIHIRPPFVYRTYGYSHKEADMKTLDEIEFIFTQRQDISAIILEPIMVNAGGYIFSLLFLKQLRALCDTHKISLIFDEVQTAFGWLGAWFASECFGVIPDMLTMGKGLGFGFPLGGILLKEQYDVLDYGEDEYTGGGHPISCAIGIEGIRYIEKNSILQSIAKKENTLKNGLNVVAQSFKKYIKEIRICGLIASVEFIHTRFSLKVYDEAFQRGLILRKSMDGYGQSLVFKPPLIVTIEEINKAIKLFNNSVRCLK